MNHPVPLRRLGVGLMLASLLLSLTACQPLTRAIRPSEAETTAAPPTADTAEESLRAYYEALISDLRQALLNAKQSDYMTRREYESRIAELESRLSDQQALPTEPPDGTDLWVSVPPVQPPAETEADHPQPISYYYTVQDGAAVIYAYRGTATQATIPATISDIPVIRIADNAFRSAPLTSVILPDTVTEIGWFAFANCEGLRTITIPASVTHIHYGAFENCPELTIICPEGSYAAEYAASFAIPVKMGDVPPAA